MEVIPNDIENMELDDEMIENVTGGSAQATKYCPKCKSNKRGMITDDGRYWQCRQCNRRYTN